jgi:hypothetical protein
MFPMSEYKFVRFQKSKAKNKKYSAIIKKKDGDNPREYILNFGDKRYQQFEDTTGLKLYSSLNHFDNKRKDNYHSRHSKNVKQGIFSPTYFSMEFLW